MLYEQLSLLPSKRAPGTCTQRIVDITPLSITQHSPSRQNTVQKYRFGITNTTLTYLATFKSAPVRFFNEVFFDGPDHELLSKYFWLKSVEPIEASVKSVTSAELDAKEWTWDLKHNVKYNNVNNTRGLSMDVEHDEKKIVSRLKTIFSTPETTPIKSISDPGDYCSPYAMFLVARWEFRPTDSQAYYYYIDLTKFCDELFHLVGTLVIVKSGDKKAKQAVQQFESNEAFDVKQVESKIFTWIRKFSTANIEMLPTLGNYDDLTLFTKSPFVQPVVFPAPEYNYE